MVFWGRLLMFLESVSAMRFEAEGAAGFKFLVLQITLR